METKKTLEFANPSFTISNRALRTERLVCGLLSLGLSAGLAAAVWSGFYDQRLYLTLGLLAAGALAGLAVWQITLFPVLRRFPYSLILTDDALVIREKSAYHYIRFCDIGKCTVNCPHFSQTYSGPGYERLDIIDGEIYYYIGELKKRFATREAERIGELVFARLTADTDTRKEAASENSPEET